MLTTHAAPTLSRSSSNRGPKELEKDNRESLTPSEAPTVVEEERYLAGSRLFFVFIGMLMSILLIALDQNIVS
jgi:hypothetical protein